MLNMLPPGASVKRIELEGVAPEDVAEGVVGERFVGIDVTEYEGGEEGRTAQRIVLTVRLRALQLYALERSNKS
jgi:hypothetical protein